MDKIGILIYVVCLQRAPCFLFIFLLVKTLYLFAAFSKVCLSTSVVGWWLLSADGWVLTLH